MALTQAQRTVNEGTTLIYTATLKDEDGTVLAVASIDSITLTLVNVATTNPSGTAIAETVINSRNAQDVKNDNNVTIHATSGLLTWEMLAADNVIVDTTLATGELEHHEATFEMVYSTTKKLNHAIDIYVKQLNKV